MDKNTQKALAAIKNISSARSLRDFRKKIYAKTDLSYGEAILAQHELIADKELIKKDSNGKRYRVARPDGSHYSFKDFLLSITNESICSDEIREILLNAGLFNENDSYRYLKELVFHLKHDLLIRVSNFTLNKKEFSESLFKGHFTPFFVRSTQKNSFFAYQAKIPAEALNVTSCVDKNATRALLFGYPVYTDGYGSFTPVFCSAIDNVDTDNADCYLRKLKNDRYFVNSCFIKAIAKNRGEQATNDLLLKLNISPVSDFDSIDNFELSKADMPFENALLLISNLFECEADPLNPQVLSDRPLNEEIKNHSELILNRAVIVPVDEREPSILYKMAQLETVLRLDEKALDNTALSCFSRRHVCNETSDITLFEDLVIGRDCDSDRLQGAGQIVLCNVLSKENSLMYVTENFDYATLCKYAAKNLMLSNSIGAVISYGNNEDNLNRTASLFKKDDDYNLNNDSDSLCRRLKSKVHKFKEDDDFPLDDFIKCLRALRKCRDIAFNQALNDEELQLLRSLLKEKVSGRALDNKELLLSEYTKLRELCQKILSKYYIGYQENKLTGFDVAKFNFATSLFIGNKVMRLCRLKRPASVESLKDFIKTVRLFDRYLKFTYEKAKLKSIEEKLLLRAGKADCKELKNSTDELFASLLKRIEEPEPSLLLKIRHDFFDYEDIKQKSDLKSMLSLVSPVCEFSTVSEMAKSLFIPGIFDKTLMMVDKNTSIADLILTFVKSKSVSIIVRKNDDADEDSETGKMSSDESDDITAYSLIDRLSVDDDGLISMRFNQKQSLDESYEKSESASSIERFIPYLEAQKLAVRKKSIDDLNLSYLIIDGISEPDSNSLVKTDGTAAEKTVMILSQTDTDRLINAESFENGSSRLVPEYFDESLFKLNARAYAKEFADRYKGLL